MVSAPEKLYTVEEFANLPEDMTDGCELIDGRIVRKHIWEGEEKGMTPGMFGHVQAVRLIWLTLEQAVAGQPAGAVFAEPTFDVGPGRNRSHRPELALITGEMPTDTESIRSLAPAMAVEVISPNNSAVDMLDKVEEYLAAGVQLVWQAFPQPRIIIAYWPDRTVVFRPGDTITAEPVLPGFSCPVADLFPPPAS